jgi:hypothetical protein
LPPVAMAAPPVDLAVLLVLLLPRVAGLEYRTGVVGAEVAAERERLRWICRVVHTENQTFMGRAFGWLEHGCYRALGIDPKQNMKWTTYCGTSLLPTPWGVRWVYWVSRA